VVLAHTKRGLRPREIALLLGISTQAVYQHLDRLRRDGELPEEASA
jgi:DNA-binding CsgD family transcriptional regulator